jgi:flavin-dependent dehydrogenase
VVVATGVNSRLAETLEEQTEKFHRPGRTKTFICEFHLGADVIRETFGPSMHVFYLDIPRLKFAALIPKGDYVTLCLLGTDIDDQLMEQFFNSPEVKNCFPGGTVPGHVCHCYPRINIKAARPGYADRMVMIGDSGTTRLFKDGIGAAYRTAKAAAKTALFHGVSAEDFKKHYAPACRAIDFDNRVGKVVFLRMTANEQKQTTRPRRMSGVLWDLFTGSAPYKDVFLRTLHPAYIGRLLWNLVAGNMPGRAASNGRAPNVECDHVKH